MMEIHSVIIPVEYACKRGVVKFTLGEAPVLVLTQQFTPPTQKLFLSVLKTNDPIYSSFAMAVHFHLPTCSAK